MQQLYKELSSILPRSFFGNEKGAAPYYSADDLARLYPELELEHSTYQRIIREFVRGEPGCFIHYIPFSPEWYARWLEEESRTDTETARIDWANAVECSEEMARKREIGIAMFQMHRNQHPLH